jgi:hypothetical protein
MSAARDLIRSHRGWVLAILVPIEICLAVLAWVDMGERPDSEVRGRKAVWRAFMVINPGNALFYWLFGRR